MKKIYILTAVFALLTLSLNAQLKADQYGNVVQPNAQTGKVNAPTRATITGSVTAANGTSTSTGREYLPVYGFYFESAQTNQMIYTATQLDGLQSGDKITSLTFYPNGNIGFSGGSITLSLGNTSISQFSSNQALSVSTTQVARVTSYPVSNGGWTITFTNPFTYTGENILVQVATTSGTYGRTYFYGQDQTNYQSRNSYGSTNRFYFLPKVTLNYERSTDPEITASTTSVNFKCQPGETLNQTVTVYGLNLTGNITATISGTDASLFSVDPSSLGATGGSLTVTYSPTAVGTHTATLTLSSTGAQDVTITLNGSCVQEQTICDGSTTSSYLPVYGTWYDASSGQHNQMIYPANLLSNLNGKDITSMTFYAPNGIQFSGGSVTFSIGTTNTNAFSSATALTDNVTAVATVVPQGETEWVIIFSDPYPYNGGNLLIQVDTETGTYAGTAFTGMEMGTNQGYYSYNSNQYTQTVLPKVTFGYEVSGPKIEVSPANLTINDSGTNNTFTVQGSNLGTDNVGLTQSGSNFVPTLTATTGTPYDGGTYWGFTPANGSVNGTVAMNYNGRDLSASETVSLGNNTGASATVTVNYRADLYIVGDFGNGWDFSTGTPMTYNSGDNTYTATVTVDAGNLILFARKLGESNPWNTRYVFGPNSSGDWWVDTNPKTGTIDLNDDDPIYFVNAGTYTVTINASTNALTIEKQVLPPPEDVVATADSENQKATVTWNAPSTLPMLPGPTTEGFDDTSKFEPFSIGGITATNHIGYNGGWTLYDPTGARVWGLDGGSFPNMSEPHAWFVMNPTHEQASGVSIMPNSPAQYMESICPLNNSSYTGGASDHWLISPELSGDAQTITFYERIITTGYDPGYETYVILVSSNDINSNDPSSGFTVLQTINSTALEWTLRSFEVPAGTKHFAIRHISNDVFGMMVDDVTYTGAVPNYVPTAPVSYNIYLDGVLVGNVDANDPLTYTFNNVTAGVEHTVEISAVYPGGIESAKESDTFTIVPKTATPTLSMVDNGDGTYTITATATSPDTGAEVTLNVTGQQPVTGTGSASITITQTNADQPVTATATALATDKLVSDEASQNFTVPALPITPTPSITYETTGGTVVVTATGEGTVYLEVDGRVVSGEGSVSITVMRSLEDRTVTATATAVAPNHQPSAETISNVPVPALAGDPAHAQEGLLRLHLLIVDQMKEDIPDDNSHPDRYGYVLKWEQPANAADRKKSGTVDVEIKKTEAQVNGYYTKTQVDNDIDHDNSELTMDVLSADVGMYLPGEDPTVLYYEMQAKKDGNPVLGEDYVTQLQYMKNVKKYEEMLETSPNKTHQYPAEETYHYFDDSTPIVTGTYGVNFMTYAPSVSTWGIQRRYFEEDGLDNTYGAPIWKTGVGRVRMIGTEAQLQRGPQGSTQWDGVGGPCSLVFLGVEAYGDLPSATVSNIVYEPYMFRVWIQSPSNSLRGCNLIPKDQDPDKPGEHWDGDGTCYGAVPVLIYEEETSDGHLYKDVEAPEDGNNVPWPSRIQFGALDSGISDLVVYVRFYYRSTGVGVSTNRDGETPEVPGYYATEGNGDPDITTGIVEMWNDFNYGEVESTTYVNAQGMTSDQPFDGVNIVVTRYTNGKVTTTKVIR